MVDNNYFLIIIITKLVFICLFVCAIFFQPTGSVSAISDHLCKLQAHFLQVYHLMILITLCSIATAGLCVWSCQLIDFHVRNSSCVNFVVVFCN